MLTTNLLIVLPSNPSSVPFRPTPFLVISSAKKIRGRRRPSPHTDRSNTAAVDEENGGFAYLSSSSDVYSNGEPPKSSMKESKDEMQKEIGGGALRGSDVLMAMQKAISQKENRGKRRDVGRKSIGGRKNDVNAMNADLVGRDARPVEIRKDWEPRLEALANRIQELQEEQHD